MKTLDEIMCEFGSDKATIFTRTWAKPHGYTPHLERFFEPLRDKPIKLAEIGVGGGESIRGWLEYFPDSKVFGIDIVANTNPYNDPNAKTHERYTFVQGDQSSEVFWKSFIKMHGGDWDVICDDGSHIAEHIVTTFDCLWPHLASNGIYEIEDLNAAENAKTWLNAQVANMHLHERHEIEFLYFARELCIIGKR